MLEGLEISELMLSQASFENRAFRIDSQYFAKAALLAETKLKAGRWEELHQLSSSVESFGAYALTNEFSYVDEGIPFLRCLNIKNGFTNFSDVLYVPETARSLLAKSEVKAGMVLLTMSGSVGNATVALPSWNYPINSNQDIAKITPQSGVNPYFLAAFIGSSYGRVQMARLPVGSVQQHIFLWMIERLVIARFSANLEQAIGNVVQTAYTIEGNSVEQVSIAEQKLLCALNLENWQPPNPLSYARSSADAFAAGRFDAEYFYPAKAAAQAHLNALPGKTIGSMFNSVRELWQPENAPANQLVRNYDLNDALSPFLDDAKESSYPAEIASTKKRIQKGDIVVSRLRSYLKEIAVVQADSKEPLVCSTEFIVLRPKAGAIPVEALLVFLRSTLPQLIFQWSQDGSNHPRFDEKELLNLHVPDTVSTISKELSDSVNAATSARQRAKELLEAAKRAVEIAIEDSEAAALAYLAEFS